MEKITADDLGIKKSVMKVTRTVAMPKGGYARARVVTKKFSMPAIPESKLLTEDDISPRHLRRK